MFFTLLISFSLSNAFSQTPFEGKVVYNLHTPQEKDVAALTVFFGKNVLRFEFKTLKDTLKPEQEYAVVYLDSGLVMTVMPQSKAYKISYLKKKPPLPTSITKEILGYKTHPVEMNARDGGILNGMFGNGVLNVANDLYYPVPDIYRNSSELLVVQNNNIVLGASFGLPEEGWRPVIDSTAVDVLMATAVVVERTNLDAALFRIPADYAPYTFAMDSALSYVDSTLTTTTTPRVNGSSSQRKKLAKKTKTPSPTNKKTSTKSSALDRRKD